MSGPKPVLYLLLLWLQTMEVGDFTSTVACFMRLTWAAAAGRLDLVGSSQPIRESTSSLLPLGVRSRVSSTGETQTHMFTVKQLDEHKPP